MEKLIIEYKVTVTLEDVPSNEVEFAINQQKRRLTDHGLNTVEVVSTKVEVS